MSDLELRPTAVATGGDAVARDASGRVVFVTGALPGELVRAELVEERRDFARARVVEVLEAGPDRVAPPCPYVAEGCGGCGWQHVDRGAQRRLKGEIVADSLRRLGHLAVDVVPGSALPASARRTTVRVAVGAAGRTGHRRARSHEVVEADACLAAHPLIEELLADLVPGDATELTLRCGARTGERLVVATPSAAGVRVPDGVVLVGDDELRAGRRAWIHEEAAGRTWRVSARSFFQSSPEGAEALVAAVGAAADGDDADPAGPVVDLYGGVGLFAGTVGRGRPTTLVERSASSVADARTNLADVGTRILRLDVDRWRPSPAGLVVADPARTGLGRKGVAAVAGTGARRAILVSCDPASLGRDARLLVDAGYEPTSCTTLDLFADTPHVEVVTTFRRPE